MGASEGYNFFATFKYLGICSQCNLKLLLVIPSGHKNNGMDGWNNPKEFYPELFSNSSSNKGFLKKVFLIVSVLLLNLLGYI